MNTNASTLILPVPGTNTAKVAEDIRDLKPLTDIPTGWEWLWWTLAILAIVGLLVWAIRAWLRHRARPLPVEIIPAHVRAQQKLEQALELIGQPRPFCIAVSDALRWYLEERFAFHAPERTTEEFLFELQATNRLDSAQKQTLADFLTRCDLVKFARHEPIRPELEDLHGSALRLVGETAPQPETNEAGEPAAVEAATT